MYTIVSFCKNSLVSHSLEMGNIINCLVGAGSKVKKKHLYSASVVRNGLASEKNRLSCQKIGVFEDSILKASNPLHSTGERKELHFHALGGQFHFDGVDDIAGRVLRPLV